MRTALLALVFIALPSAAAAQEQIARPNRQVIPDYVPSAPRPPPMVEKTWYGWQTLLMDGAALTSFVMAGNSGKSDYLIASAVMYSLGVPTVHWAHGFAGRGFGSMGLRAALPLGGAAGLCMLETGRSCGVAGALLGLAGAVILDAARATEDVEVSALPKAGFTIAPTASIARDNALLGIHGAF